MAEQNIRIYRSEDCVTFRKTTEPFGGLSNMAPGLPLSVNRVFFLTSEALYQCCRFPDAPEIQSLVIHERSPMTAKMRIKPSLDKTRPDWERVRVGIMRWCLRVKLSQNFNKFGTLLRATQGKPIVEDSRRDMFWGAVPNEHGELVGQNVLGRLLMELREELLNIGESAFVTVVPPSIPNFFLLGKEIGPIAREPLSELQGGGVRTIQNEEAEPRRESLPKTLIQMNSMNKPESGRPRLSLAQFVERWKAVTLTERSAAQSHFIDLCEVLEQPHPAAADQVGNSFTFEKHVSQLHGGKGFSDVWRRGFFAWEYKGKHKDLGAAYNQLAEYREDLENPPLLVVCDLERFEVHTNFTGTLKRVYKFTLDDLLSAAPTANCALPPLDVLRALFTAPELLRPDVAAARVTEAAAGEFAKLAASLRSRGVDSERAAHFLMRLLFCLFADSIGLLPENLFRQMLDREKGGGPAKVSRKLRQLFAAMSASGSNFGVYDIHYFNGGLFADDETFDLNEADLVALRTAAELDWSSIEPAIFGTLFERSLDPGKRSQLGAHYTSKEDILLIVEPVVMAPLEFRWHEVRSKAEEFVAKAQETKGAAYNKLRTQLQEVIFDWVEELSKVRILDPACGSGNFLYVALRRMLDLWKRAYVFAAEHGLPTFLPFQVNPSQLYGLETNVYAHELASVVVWIGYLQWLKENGIGFPVEPILRKLDNIQHRDAILTRDPADKPIEPPWPEADFIIGNPPFLGGGFLRRELGNEYVDSLYRVYEGRITPQSDLVTYWFEKARALVEIKGTKRAGLIATQSIRGGINRQVLERIKASGDIFMAWSDKEWLLEGGAVNFSLIGFDDGSQAERILNGRGVTSINPDLTDQADTTTAFTLKENANLCFRADEKGGPFDIEAGVAQLMLAAPVNVNGRPNSDVLCKWINASDITGRSRDMWIIDFYGMTQEQAAAYEMPFEHLVREVERERLEAASKGKETQPRARWWLHRRPGSEMRKAVAHLQRYIGTIATGKHRPFVWLDHSVLPDHQLYIFARADDYFFGVLHSRMHEAWARNQGTQLREAESGSRYTPTSTFETFPFPWPPGHEPNESLLVKAIAEAACELVKKRDAWLNPPNASAEELKKRTLTSLYNANPAWLVDAHRKLDAAVFAAYGWPENLTDAELLERLLALNHERASAHGQALSAVEVS